MSMNGTVLVLKKHLVEACDGPAFSGASMC
jgi:hypothetical protein